MTLRGDLAALPLGQALTDPKTRETVTLDQDAERWARLLRWALRSSELQVSIQEDTIGPLDTSADDSPVAALRRQLGLTARQAAAEIGVSQPALTSAEKRGPGIALDTLDRYATALGATLSLQLRTPTTRLHWAPPAAHESLRERLQAVGRGAVGEQLRAVGGGLPSRLEDVGRGVVLDELEHGSGGVYEVLPKQRGEGWRVRRTGTKRATSTHDTQDEAIAAARPLAQRAGGGEIVVHDRDGQIRDRVAVDNHRGGRA